MRTIITTIALLTAAPALAYGGPAPQQNEAIERLIPMAELDDLRRLYGEVVTARNAPATPAGEIAATKTMTVNLDKAIQAATKARLALNRTEFDKQALNALRLRDQACAILTAC